MDTITKAIAEQWSGKPCYLDGAPAKVTDRLCPFAIVATLDPSGPSIQYSWHAVNIVMRERAAFFETH